MNPEWFSTLLSLHVVNRSAAESFPTYTPEALPEIFIVIRAQRDALQWTRMWLPHDLN